MITIYILSGKLFGKNIYEIDCINNINDRMINKTTGFPDSNILHYSIVLHNIDIQKCKIYIYDSFYKNQLQKGNFYKIDLDNAIEKVNKLKENIIYFQDLENKENNRKRMKNNYFCF